MRLFSVRLEADRAVPGGCSRRFSLLTASAASLMSTMTTRAAGSSCASAQPMQPLRSRGRECGRSSSARRAPEAPRPRAPRCPCAGWHVGMTRSADQAENSLADQVGQRLAGDAPLQQDRDLLFIFVGGAGARSLHEFPSLLSADGVGHQQPRLSRVVSTPAF